MTETHATLGPDAPVFPAGRYGRRRAPRRRRPVLAALLAVVVVATLTVVSVRLYRQYGDPAYDAQVISYGDITDDQVVVDFRVNLPDGGSAVCVLRARDHAGAEVAREEVPVTAVAGQPHVTVRHRLATTARPFIGEVVRCRPPV
ncbi:DUF4307 domain-containing protein [Verrucosispora sp. WMMA2044]|uniref:DUF4307 domain-containing protein n=1 Tax=Verrucosispora sioxanthis TaxID=2499994 RepID=A0A6M1L1W8_9ACTN|nr:MULTISPECIES: DUF4307 domain-containing protein [Micromonospora]NEE63047.1 DUF4307 domain-containing protein [Verrucosispora sioxanthis]NGM12157.1 DUF4307 domain-containing protein [Verrucosispora sioxanthis]WBB47556.1 DUF4307 domain-containing protein [Verrucosispora sp. WMMA2044]